MTCWVRRAWGVQEFGVRHYPRAARATRFWRSWTAAASAESTPGCFVRRGKVLVLPLGGGAGVDAVAYHRTWCTWAAHRTGGRVVTGLR